MAADAPRPSRLRGIAFRLLAVAFGLLAVELGVRVVSAFISGPRTLLYGTPWYRDRVMSKDTASVAFHEVDTGAYTKYFPHEQKWANDTRGRYRVRINDHGLRGPDFATAKAPGRRRVLTLGASSTFGFENRDHETYPFYLQALLDRRAGLHTWEIINFAVPHADSDAIAAMFLAEGVALSPDVVTVYEGINDAKRAVFDEVYGSSWRNPQESPFLSVTLARQLYLAAFPPPAHLTVTDTMIRAAIDRYIGNLEQIRAACRRIGAQLVVVTQQARSTMIEPKDLHGVSYADEVRFVQAQLTSAEHRFNAMQEYVGGMFVVHARLMQALHEWTARNGVPLVDGVARLDGERDLIITWVHLAPPANKALAKALANTLVALPPATP